MWQQLSLGYLRPVIRVPGSGSSFLFEVHSGRQVGILEGSGLNWGWPTPSLGIWGESQLMEDLSHSLFPKN